MPCAFYRVNEWLSKGARAYFIYLPVAYDHFNDNLIAICTQRFAVSAVYTMFVYFSKIEIMQEANNHSIQTKQDQ